MKTVGLLGGMSWESTIGYYQSINRGVREKLGGLSSAQIVLYSVNFEPVERHQRNGDWPAASEILSDAARKIESAGADFLLICTNTMHKVYDDISLSVGIPVLHIADATAERLKATGVSKVGLIGTRFTMEQAFYKDRLQSLHGIDVVVPQKSDRTIIHKVIYEELCRGVVSQASKKTYLEIVKKLALNGAQAVILGCTEIGLLIAQKDTEVPLMDTTEIHAEKAVELLI